MLKNSSNILKDVSTEHNSQKKSVLHRISIYIIEHLEDFFYWYGMTVAKRPYHFIALCIIITLFSSFGIAKFNMEERPFKLWIPQDSDFIESMKWQKDNFPQKFRIQMAIYEADNVLNKDIILELYKIHDLVSKISTPNATRESTCAKVPIIPDNPFSRKKRSVNLENKNADDNKVARYKRELPWWVSLFSREDFCQLNKVIQKECLEHSLLEVWGYNEELLKSLSSEDIIRSVNEADSSAVFGIPKNFSELLGGIVRDDEGRIVGAKAMMHIWITEISKTDLDNGDFVYDKWTGMMVDKNAFGWENVFVDQLLNYSKQISNFKLYVMSASSFGLVTESTIQGDITYFAIGFFVVFIYAQIMLGKFNCVEQRPLLSLVGIACVAFAIIISYGLCSAVGIMYGPVNNALPFLLLGLGVDDMFVIIQSFINLTPKEQECDLQMRIGFALKHAGVSITITSLTDVVAFAIGATTILPALRSFCIYAAVGITSVYLLQATFFVAWLTLDQKRLEDSRQGLFWCIKFKNFTPNKFSQRDLMQSFFKNVLSRILLKPWVKAFVLVFTFCLLGVSAWGLYNLEQEFHPIWFLPQSSYIFQFFSKLNKHFQSDGDHGHVFFGNISILEIPKLDYLANRLRSSEGIGKVDSWYDGFQTFWIESGNDISDVANNETLFLDGVSEFLFSPFGSQYRIKNFIFEGNLSCTETAPHISAFTIDFKHKVMSGSRNKIRAMEEVKEIVKSANFTGYAEPWALIYSGWETDKVIETELYRNMGLALLVVGLMMLALIASFTTSSIVLVCVLMTLVDVGGLMHWWGLTIDTVSCIDLVLAIGLCVDYAAHIGHTFMTQEGSRDQRAKATLTKIGPAVLNGGLSNVLAFIFLAKSDSHVFKTFFKIFFGVSLYGLFHGLVFLPVVLSLVGPASYGESKKELPTSFNPNSKDLVKLNTIECQSFDSIEKGEELTFNGEFEQLKYCKETVIM